MIAVPRIPNFDAALGVGKILDYLERVPRQRRVCFERLRQAGWYTDPEWACTAAERFAAEIADGRQ
jgi:hypothetical protein